MHLPPGDTSNERTLQIDGTSEKIESAKLLVNEVISVVVHVPSNETTGFVCLTVFNIFMLLYLIND